MMSETDGRRETSRTPPSSLHASPFTLPSSYLRSPPYRSLAAHYDAVMAHVDYPGWGRHLRGLWRTVRGRGEAPRRVLELAAGTCRLAPHIDFPGAFAVQTDLSPAMLRAADPVAAEALPLRRAACDARALPFPTAGGADAPGFDLACMVYDSLNYMMSAEDVRLVFDEVRRVLAPGGVFLVDVTTAACSRRWFADTQDFLETDAGAAARTSRYDAETRTQLNLFTFFTRAPDGRYDRIEEVHRQRIWPAALLKKTARAAGFDVRACLADFTLNPGTDRHERLHFVLQKP